MYMATILQGNNEFGSPDDHPNTARSRSWRRHSNKWSPPPDVPKGSLAVYVGQEDIKRFVIPISYLRHPLFRELLKKSEEEFGFCHEGALHLHCNVAVFCRVLDRIQNEDLARRVKMPRGPIGLTFP